MKIIFNNEEIRKKLISLILDCETIKIAVAWVRTGNQGYDLLIENKSKIKMKSPL
jgi:HKD family nuclease